MQRLEVSGVVRPIYGSLGVKWLVNVVSASVREFTIFHLIYVYLVHVCTHAFCGLLITFLISRFV